MLNIQTNKINRTVTISNWYNCSQFTKIITFDPHIQESIIIYVENKINIMSITLNINL